MSKTNYTPNLKNIAEIERKLSNLLFLLSERKELSQSSLLKYFVSVIVSNITSPSDIKFKQLSFRKGKHFLDEIDADCFKNKTIWGYTNSATIINEELNNALGHYRLGLDMFISRIPDGTSLERFGSLTIAPNIFTDQQEQDLKNKFDESSFLFPSSLFLLGDLGNNTKKPALPVVMISSEKEYNSNFFEVKAEELGVNFIVENEHNGDVDIFGEKWLKGEVNINKTHVDLRTIYKQILSSYKRWTGYDSKISDSLPLFGIIFIPSGNDYQSRTALLCPVKLDLKGIDSIVTNATLLVKLIGGILEKYLAHAVEGRVNEKLVLASTKSAIASIMSRNGSHNIGSHVLSALSHNVGTMPDDRLLYQYIQHRMDYIASATTAAPNWSVPTQFVSNVMKMLYSQRHLLEHIVESDGLHAYQYQGKGTQFGNQQKNCVKIIVRKLNRRVKEGTEDDWELTHINNDTIYWYQFFKDNQSVNWKYDEILAIPGGILGQHAFYNIVENVLRNAAKHSWARKRINSEVEPKNDVNTNGKTEQTDKEDNLEVYIDFEKNTDDGMMCFTIGDNLSKLFPGKFWQKFFSDNDKKVGEKSLPELFSAPLDGYQVFGDAKDENKKYKSIRLLLEKFLKWEENISIKDLPKHYQILYEYVGNKWDILKDDEDFTSLLKGKTPDKENILGHRLPLPLHHRQEITLAEPFINPDTNQLRQSSWGLSEMKISAGYLRRASVSVIGGIKDKIGDKPLIVPVGIPRNEDTCNFSYKNLCLAYRFWIKLPKDILIVSDEKEQWERIQSDNINVISYNDIFGEIEEGEKGKLCSMSDFGFVLIDHNGTIENDIKLQLPFRSLLIVDQISQSCDMPYVLREDLNGDRENFVSCVYFAWLRYLKERRFGHEPKNLLIIADNVDEWLEKKNDIIDAYSYDDVFGEKGNIGLVSNYEFVLIDSNRFNDDDRLKLPFKALQILDKENYNCKIPFVLRSSLCKENGVDFLIQIYQKWLAQRQINIKLNIYDEQGSEKGLISNRDIYKVLFRECLHSVLEPISDNWKIDRLQRKALLLISLFPLNEDDDLFKADTEMYNGNHCLNIENFLGQIATKVKEFLISFPLACKSEDDCKKWNSLNTAYRAGFERAKQTMRDQSIVEEVLNELSNQERFHEESILLQEIDNIAKEPSKSEIIKLATQALDVARTTSDIFLRKYEERIVTLPQQYKTIEEPKNSIIPFNKIGVNLIFKTNEKIIDISYNRHSTDKSPLYSEPLSGSQTYLNALAKLSTNDEKWAMRLAENGLLRVVIIDERVRNFIIDHDDEIRKTFESMHISVVDTERKPPFTSDGFTLSDFTDNGWNYVAGGLRDSNFANDFDIVVIHQGIIDKWWPFNHNTENVKEILNNLRHSKKGSSFKSRFVVVTTGRGRPDNIPCNEKVLAFSSIEAFLFKRYPEKINLINSLMNILPGSPDRSDNDD